MSAFVCKRSALWTPIWWANYPARIKTAFPEASRKRTVRYISGFFTPSRTFPLVANASATATRLHALTIRTWTGHSVVANITPAVQIAKNAALYSINAHGKPELWARRLSASNVNVTATPTNAAMILWWIKNAGVSASTTFIKEEGFAWIARISRPALIARHAWKATIVNPDPL